MSVVHVIVADDEVTDEEATLVMLGGVMSSVVKLY